MVKRMQLLWKFVKMIPHAKEIEAEIRQQKQDFFDTDFANQMYCGKLENEKAYKGGFMEGVQWALNRFS